MNTKYSTRQQSGQRGAALILAIAIMTILLAVALTFYGVSRAEMENATNVRNRVQADLVIDSALAMTFAELNRDFLKHPNATSNDFKPFALFNGSWAAGKQWALRNGIPLQAGGVPLVNLTAMPFVEFPDGSTEQLYSGPTSRDWLYYPRIEGATPHAYGPAFDSLVANNPYDYIYDPTDPDRPPFVTPAYYGPGDLNANFIPDLYDGLGNVPELYPLEWIHTWTDVDNDEDGLNDSIWIPIPQDRFFSGGEVVDEITGRRMFDDGIDNDLDGMVDENPENGVNEDAINEVVLLVDDADEAMEIASFVYYGGDDGLDNDGNGLIDSNDPSERGDTAPYFGLFLAAPLPGLTIPIDFNADGIVPDKVPFEDSGILDELTVTLPLTIDVLAPAYSALPVSLDSSRVDVLDNDFDMLINNQLVYAYVGPNTATGPPFILNDFREPGVTTGPPIVSVEHLAARNSVLAPGDPHYNVWRLVGNWAPGDQDLFLTARLKAYDEINIPSALSAGMAISPSYGEYYSPVTDSLETYNFQALLPGILRITHAGEAVCDLAGRAAVLVRDESSKANVNAAGGHTLDASTGNLVRSLGAGASTSEYETRVLTAIGPPTAAGMWTTLTGYPEDDSDLGTISQGYAFDAIYPGYGRVDDNGNILWAALNGIDDDGDGLIDEGLYLPPLGDPSFPVYYALLGDFEGTDDPGELQRYRPLPNLLAENREPFRLSGLADGIDNDRDDATDERGELGDLQLQDTLQISGVIPGAFSDIRQSITAYSTDRNVNFIRSRSGFRGVNKLDYNFATPQQIAANLLISNPLQTVTAAPLTTNFATNRFAAGLLQGDIHLRSTNDPANGLTSGLMWSGGAPSVEVFPADPVLQAMQTAVDIVDFRDPGHSRSTLTTERQKATPQTAMEDALFDTWPNRLSIRERIADDAYFPLEEIQEELVDVMGIERKIEFIDEWWGLEAGVAGTDGNAEQQRITYTASGNESIKINELMVRPVRRIEAEAIPSAFLPADAEDPMFAIVAPGGTFNPQNFDPQAGFPGILPAFEVTRRQSGANWVFGSVSPVPFIGETSYLTTATAGEVIQFRIRATDGLPEGRYYVTVNTNGTVTPQILPPLGPGPMLEYSVRYEVAVPGDIISDGVGAQFREVPNEHISDSVPGAPPGSAFLSGTTPGLAPYFMEGAGDPIRQSTTGETFTVFVREGFDVYIAFRLTALHNGTPIQIDSLDFSQEPDHEWIELVNVSDEPVNVGGWHLEVGIPHTNDTMPPDPFRSRWRIPPGTVVAPDGMVLLAFDKFDHFQRDFTLDDTGLIRYPGYKIAENGMGLARGINQFTLPDTAGFLSYTQGITNRDITVPPIADVSLNIPFGERLFGYNDLTGSVFDRPVDAERGLFIDYVDRDGDGVSSAYFNFAADVDNALLEQNTISSTDGQDPNTFNALYGGTGITMGSRPWDRIIQLENLQLGSADPLSVSPLDFRLQQVQTVDDVARLVLRGGVLPNYPERDGIDNDGDGGYLALADPDGAGPIGLVPTYFPGTLETDMVDNNLDGVIDERGIVYYAADGVDNDGDGLVDEPGDARLPDGIDNDLDGLIDELDETFILAAGEGVDEGRIIGSEGLIWRSYGVGTYEPLTLPRVYFGDRAAYNNQYDAPVAINAPGTYVVPVDGGAGYGFDATSTGLIPGLIGRAGDGDIPVGTPPGYITLNAPYVGNFLDPPDWKAFNERRWNPGDSVIVTLYENDAREGKVADRVTYSEFDVINRTIDDLQQFGIDADGDGALDTPLTLNPDYPSFWPANQMALDFYRSLERKHPFYNGDRFGTTNRWEATDGNYDDWADSLSYFENELETAVLTPDSPLSLSNNSLVDLRTRFNNGALSLEDQFRQARLFFHAMEGTPLRMNTAARMSENPRDLEGVLLANDDPVAYPDPRQFPDPNGSMDWFRTHEDRPFGALLASTESLREQGWNHNKAFVANRRFTNPGDLMNVTHQTYLHDAVNTAAAGGSVYLRDMTMVNYGIQGDTGFGDSVSRWPNIALRGATLGQDAYGNSVTGSNLLTEAIESMALESAVLTVGQAEFRPIRPDLGAIAAADRPGVVDWLINPLSTSGSMFAPASWAPVFLFPLPDDTLISDVDRYPYYPTNVDGSNFAVQMRPDYLFNGNYLEDNMGAAYLGGLGLPWNDPIHPYRDRWPLERRATMYVSEVRPGVVGTDRPEGLFVWDGEDGLENGEYELYIGTFIPGLQDRALQAAGYSAGFNTNVPAKSTPNLLYGNAGDDVTPDGINLPMDRVTATIMTSRQADASATRTLFAPEYAIDVVTDPSEARGVAPPVGAVTDPTQKPGGLINPADWNPAIRYRAGDDGYIFYGNNAVGGWKPQVVTVTDNFLAVRVRNVGEPGQIGVITHIVLAPRKRTPGRVNLNTTISRIAQRGGATHENLNVALGLPGVVDAGLSVVPSNDPNGNAIRGPYLWDDSIAVMEYTFGVATTFPWASPAQMMSTLTYDPSYGFGLVVPPARNMHGNLDPPASPFDPLSNDGHLLVPPALDDGDNSDGGEELHRLAAYRLNHLMEIGRTEHADGRYYESIGDLVSESSGYSYNYSTGRPEPIERVADTSTPFAEINGADNAAVYPLSNDSSPSKRFDESQARFRRMGNLVTTRSDVYEITITAEAGYGVDRDGDGFINYRDPNEFVTTARTKASAVYERRTPSGQAAGER